ncbi:hypothetical protein E4T56_gene2468 [Termitomyces sp. T112]|nr:hypothetical protein E4T56_gene2468 [Termitomyces sp. T112]
MSLSNNTLPSSELELSIPAAYSSYPSSPYQYSYSYPCSSPVSLPSLSSWGAVAPSSPRRESSPSPSPMTPEREFGSCAGVRSSPVFGLGFGIGRKVDRDVDDQTWTRYEDANANAKTKTKTQTTLPGIQSLFADELYTARVGVKVDASRVLRCCCWQHRYAHNHAMSNFEDHITPTPPSTQDHPHSDEHVDIKTSLILRNTNPTSTSTNINNSDESENSGVDFTNPDIRATFFRISAERGRWRYDSPMHLHSSHPQPRLQRPHVLHRQSTPVESPPPILGLNVPRRPISEPLPLTPTHAEDRMECEPQILSCVIETGLGTSSPDLALASGGDTMAPAMDVDPGVEMGTRSYSSPLPPSSPPLPSSSPSFSSPALPMRMMVRSVSISPLSFAPSSPRALPPSSPLEFFDELSALDEQESQIGTEPEPEPEPEGENENENENDGNGDENKIEDDEKPNVSEQSDIVRVRRESGLDLDSDGVTSAFYLPEYQELSALTESCVGSIKSDTPDPDSHPDSDSDPGDASRQGAGLCLVLEGYVDLEASCIELEKREREGDPVVSAWCGDVGDSAVEVVDVAMEVFGNQEEVGVGVGEMDGESEGGGLASSLSRQREGSKVKDWEGAVGALRMKDENGVGVNEVGLVKREKRKDKGGNDEREREGDVMPRKKARVELSGLDELCVGVEKRKGKEVKRRIEEDFEAENRPAPKLKKQKQKQKKEKVDKDGLTQKRSSSSTSSPTSTSTSKHKTSVHTSTSSSSSSLLSNPRPSDETKPKLKPPSFPPKDPETEALHAEIRGMIIESMATSRASCLPASALYKNAMQCRPSLGAQRSEKEWMEIIERVLGEGEAARGGCGVFGKVESSFKDESGRPLEAQWFYVPEMDEDQERAALIRSMMPRPAKRNVTKKYKQYYYRPLAKITRWDPEDDL